MEDERLTPYEREILGILQEECAEVIVAVSKLLRFGPQANPTTGIVNRKKLGLEIGDIVHVVDLLTNNETINVSDIEEGADHKYQQLKKYLKTKP